MFRRYAGSIPGGANALFLQHPAVLTTLLEVAWQFRQHGSLPLGDPKHRSNLPQLPGFWLDPLREAAAIVPPGATASSGTTTARGELWEHLIYAYMIENTRVYEIFRRVLHEYLHGEKLGIPNAAAQHWLRNTEELFYRDPPALSITNVTSDIRCDMRASRRNAYQRMFGMDLNHGTDDGKPYAYVKSEVYNNEFVTIFEEFLREVWIAISNIGNSSGVNLTDRSKIENLVQNLQNMLMSRRVNGNLSREEFSFVSIMSWFHLSLQENFPIIQSLQAEASSPEQRLFKIAQRVGLPAQSLSKSYFDISDPLSRILLLIEGGGLNSLPAAPTVPFAANVQSDLNIIITHWSIVTGRDMKARKVATA